MDSGFSILIKYLSGSLSTKERQELEVWQSLSSENQQLFSDVKKLRLLNEFNYQNNIPGIALALTKVRKRIHYPISGESLRNFVKYAAAVIIVVSLSIFGLLHLSGEAYTIISVAENESIKKVRLDDGTLVWLSASSELRIPESFSTTNRKVSFKGKAYFDVKKDPESPFRVTSNYLSIKVTGTSFDLFVDDEGRHVETILVSGKVILQNSHKKDVFEMSPGEKVVFEAETGHFIVSTVDVNTFTSWHLDQITFENATLREIVNKLSLIYDVNINLESKKLADHRYRYVINREETLIEVLEILKYLAPIHYSIEGNEVFITEKEK